MARFFEGGMKQVRKTQESVKAQNRIKNLVTNIGKDTAKKVTRQETAKRAQRQYNNPTVARDSNIVKSVKEFFNGNPTQLQQNARGGSDSSSIANAGAFNFSYSGGQFSRAGTQARDTLNSIIPQPGDMKAYAEFAAKRDTSTDEISAHFYDKYALPHSDIGPDAHNLMIGRGQDWMTDSEALTDWILGGLDFESGNITEADLDAARKRQQQYEDYMDKYLRDVPVFDPEFNGPKSEKQFTEDAPLPPWIQPTSANIDTWEYYKTYSHDVVQSTADAYTDYMNEKKEFAKHPYKSAFSTERNEQDVDSFLDILVSSRSFNDLKNNTKNYFRDYIINPIKAGDIMAAGGNALWNMMDTMDIASRGARAFTAGATVLGGRNVTFKGQNVYWTKLDGYTDEESQRAQKIFMDNGGYELLLKAHPGEATKADLASSKANMSEEELIAKLNQAFAKEGINWRTIYNDLDKNYFSDRATKDLSQAVENVKLAYSDPSAAFYADTGSMAANVLIESALDPGLVFGGVSKNISKNTVRSVSDNAIRDGLVSVLRNADQADELMRNKKVRAVIKAFINTNEGKNIIFKNSKAFNADVDVLIKDIARNSDGIFSTEASRETFKRTVTAHLIGKNTNINGKIIDSTNWARRALDSKTFKAAYYMDKAIDGIDSAIVKSSFAAPWLLVKGIKGGKRVLASTDAVGRIVSAQHIKAGEAARAVRDELTGAVDVTRAKKLILKAQAGEVDIRSAQRALKEVSQEYDKLAVNINAWIPRYLSGELTDDDVMKLVSDQIYGFTNGKYTRVSDLAAEVASQDVRYAQDIQNSYIRLDKQFSRLSDVIARHSDDAQIRFLDEVGKIDNIDELRSLYRANYDNPKLLALRQEVLDKSVIEGLTEVDLDRIVSDVQNGLFTERDVTVKDIKKATQAVAKASDNVVERTVSVSDFKSLLTRDFQDLLNDALDPNSKVRYPNKLMEILIPSENTTSFSLDYLKKTIDSSIGSLEYTAVKDYKYDARDASRILSADSRIAELRRLRDAVLKLDTISLKDVEVVTQVHVDRMALLQNFVNSPSIKKLHDKAYNTIVAPVVDMLTSKQLNDADLASDSLFAGLLRLKELQYGYARTNTLKSELMSLRGFSDAKLHTVLNGLGNNFGRKYGSLQDIVRTPGLLRRNLEATVRAQFGTSKLSMERLTDMLKSINSDSPSEYLKPYLKEIEEDTTGELKAWFNSIANGDTLTPQSYVDKQMLSAILLDPSLVDDYNAMAKAGKSPIFFHISTTGLSSELNDITAVSYRKWVPIDLPEGEKLSLAKIKAAFDSADTDTFIRGLSDAEIDAISENNLRHMADWKGLSSSQIRDEYKKVFGASDSNPQESESELLERVCSFLNAESVHGTERVIPNLVVHDLDGFNIPFFNRRVAEASRYASEESKVYDYSVNILNRIQNNSSNTYDRLASRIGDNSFTAEEVDQTVEILTEYIDDIGRYAGDNYDMLDFSEYGEVLNGVISSARQNADVDDDLFEIRNAIVKAVDSYGTYADDYADYLSSTREIANLNIYPKQFAFTSSGVTDNAVYTALKATGRDTINVESRIYIKDVLSYFNIGDEDTGFNVTFDALDRMHNLSQYVIRNRDKAMVAGAEDFLLPYKESLDAFIASVTSDARLSGYESSEFEFLRSIKIPDTAVESYLVAQKLYDDYGKFWLSTDNLSSYSRSASDVNTLKLQYKDISAKVYAAQKKADNVSAAPELRERMYDVGDMLHEEVCDHLNNYRTKLLSETLAGRDGGLLGDAASEELLKLLDGANRPDIFKAAANADYSKTIYSYRDGVLREGIEMASKVSEANSNIRKNIRQLETMGRFYQNAGLTKTADRTTAMLHHKAKNLFDMLEASDLPSRESFQNFMRRASEIQRLKLQQYAIDSLKVDGAFDRTRLLQELVYNKFNHIAFNSHAYNGTELSDLKRFVADLQKNGDDFISYYEDRSTGNVFVYLNYKSEIATDGKTNFLNRVEIPRPTRNAIGFSDFNELKSLIDDIDDIEDFREVYRQLTSCWEDTRMLSQGAINGTSGKVVSRKQAEEYLATIPSEMSDMLSPKGMLMADTARDIVYDPGFVRNDDTDLLVDYLETLSREADIAKEDAILVNEVFSGNSTIQFNELAVNFTDDELISYFGNNPDYVVVTLTANPNTRTGLQVRQLKLDNPASLRVARTSPNTTILPYDMFYEIADTMNRSQQDGYYRRLLGKYLLAYKAFALVKPGTWMRNYIDATTKAALDGGEDITNIFTLMSYQGKAARDVAAYSRIMKADPSLLNKANWEIIQRSFKTDMTFDDFQLLKGVMDSNQYRTADKAFLNKAAMKNGGLNTISGEDIGLRNLDEKDITTAFSKYMKDEVDLPLSRTDFIDIYLGRKTADREVMDQFESMMRILSTNMQNADASTLFDKSVNLMFKPFGAVESLARYSQTMYLRDMGLSANQTLKHIHLTQFYTAPTWGAFNKLETIMPFITFRYNNFMYWMRMMDENPRFFRYFEDIYGTITEDTIENMMEDNESADYSTDMLWQNGAVPLGDSGLNIKIGNSFLSAINDFYGGPDMLIGRQGSLNPLLREGLRFSAYALGLQSSEFFSGVDLDVSKDIAGEGLVSLLPGGNFMIQAKKLITKLPSTFDDNGPSMNTLFQTLSFMGVLGIRQNYSSGGNFDYNEWLDELARQGKWFDSNLGKIVPLSEKNSYGANNPLISWEDRQAYMMMHFGKVWDPNQSKFVTRDELSDGNFDIKFDFENDPEAWDKLQKWMKLKGKVYDYNQRKFVLQKDYISGGLNDPNMTFEERSALIYDKFGLRWDGNQNTYVDDRHYIAGGLNDTKNFNEVKSLRLALYGEVWDRAQHKFVKAQDSSVVTIGNFFGGKEYDEYFSRLAIPRLQNINMNFHVNNEGLLVTDDGKYILTKNDAYNARVFEKFKHTFGSRGYRGWKRYSHWKNFNSNKKPYKGRTLPSHYYTGYGWNDEEGYYRLNYQYNYQYHNPEPAKKLNRLLSPRVQYPYGGGYNKYSFYTR